MGSGRTPERLIVVGAVLLGILIAKPWGESPPVSPAPAHEHETSQEAVLGDAATTPAALAPTVSPGPEDIACEGGWRLVSITHEATWTIKDWTRVDPSPGPGPVGPNIPFIAVSGVIRAIGVCGDGQELGDPDRNVSINRMWRVTNTAGQVSAASVSLQPTADRAQPAEFARLYRPARATGATAWSAGRYVLELDVAGATSWLGIVVSGQSATPG
jgi:hypothetical protein